MTLRKIYFYFIFLFYCLIFFNCLGVMFHLVTLFYVFLLNFIFEVILSFWSISVFQVLISIVSVLCCVKISIFFLHHFNIFFLYFTLNFVYSSHISFLSHFLINLMDPPIFVLYRRTHLSLILFLSSLKIVTTWLGELWFCLCLKKCNSPDTWRISSMSREIHYPW